MNNSPQNQLPADRSSDAHEIRSELSSNEDALRALNEIVKEPEQDVEIPPVPEDLREQWRERYGEASERAAIPTQTESGWSFRKLFPIAGLALPALVAMLFFFNQSPLPSGTPGNVSQNDVVLRGGGEYSPGPDTVTLFIPSETISFAEMAATRGDGLIFEINDSSEATTIMGQKDLTSAILVDARNGLVYPLPGSLDNGIPLLENVAEADQFDFSEAIDSYLEK